MKAAIIVFPGSNRERDVAQALAHVGGSAVYVWHRETVLPQADLIILPGGFSYGDYLRPGAIAARAPILRAIISAAQCGTPVLGICNGFQVLCESGLLPGTLRRNAHLKFACKFVTLRVEENSSCFTCAYKAGQIISLPLAHHDGNYFADAGTLTRLEGDGRIALRYADGDGRVADCANPNGSQANIAGVFSADYRILGLMPHPENAVDPLCGGTDGQPLFASLMVG